MTTPLDAPGQGTPQPGSRRLWRWFMAAAIVVLAVVALQSAASRSTRSTREKALATALLALHQKSFPSAPAAAGGEILLPADQAPFPGNLLPERPISFQLRSNQVLVAFDEHRIMGVETLRSYVLTRDDTDRTVWRLSYFGGGLLPRRNILTVRQNPPRP